MRKYNRVIVSLLGTTALIWTPFSMAVTQQGLSSAPQPTSCLITNFSKTGNDYWSNVSIQITNQCGQNVDMRNTTLTFNNADNLNTNFWGSFGSISYPDNSMQITSQPNGQSYISSLSFHVPDNDWSNSLLANGQSIVLQYGAATAGYDANSAKVYVDGQAVKTGTLVLNISGNKPDTTSANPVVDILDAENNIIQKVTVPWGGQQNVVLAPGAYSIHPETITVSDTTSYVGTANPQQVTVDAGKTLSSTITYTAVVQNAHINVTTQKLPNALSGYTQQPAVTLTSTTGSALTQTVKWGETTQINQLANSMLYTLTSATIDYNGSKCIPSFNPSSLMSSEKSPQTTQLTYVCSTVKQDQVSINVKGLPATTTSITTTFTPSNGANSINKTIDISNGSGNDSVSLTDGAVYNVSTSNVTGYTASVQPQTLTVNSNSSVSINYQAAAAVKGHIAGYLPGWLGNISPTDLSTSPYSAEKLSAAGYTDVLVAFGLFSTTQPGQISTGAFDCAGCVTKAYVDSLHSKGIKVILSLGGAATGVPNTSVDFHGVLSGQDPETFKNTFVKSVETILQQYGFDGIDIDIEHGLGPKVSGSRTEFVTPASGSDIDVLAKIINQLHADNPSVIVTMAPQTANISPNPNAFDATWGNYSSLIMQTYKSITWVGIQLYNTGCTNGIDSVCYPDTGASPDYSVAMAADLLENWPQTNKNGQSTAYMPYTSYLQPQQVVLGYPAPNAQGVSDGGPVTSTPVIKQAISCLQTGSTGCSQYKPPRPYTSIGGAFEWSLQYDQGNQYKFASDLVACVINGNCN